MEVLREMLVIQEPMVLLALLVIQEIQEPMVLEELPDIQEAPETQAVRVAQE
jgi:hypothetical protein